MQCLAGWLTSHKIRAFSQGRLKSCAFLCGCLPPFDPSLKVWPGELSQSPGCIRGQVLILICALCDKTWNKGHPHDPAWGTWSSHETWAVSGGVCPVSVHMMRIASCHETCYGLGKCSVRWALLFQRWWAQWVNSPHGVHWRLLGKKCLCEL